MSEIINLRQARKQRDRDNKHKASTIKRMQFGENKDEKSVVRFTRAKREKHLDDHKRDLNADTD